MQVVNIKQKEEWSRQALRILNSEKLPHFAPKQEILKVHQENIDLIKKNITSPHVLILGATPQLADLALTNNCFVYRVDNNLSMFDAAKKYETVKQRCNENIIINDWLSMKEIEDNRIDLILGDASLNNVLSMNMLDLFEELKRVSHTGSLLSFKQIVFPDKKINDYHFEKVVKSFREIKLTQDEFYLILRFYSFKDLAYDTKSCLLDAGIVFDLIEKKYKEGKLSESEYAIFDARRGLLKHTIYNKTEQQKLFREHLGETSVIYPNNSCVYRDIFNMFSIKINM